MNTHRAQMLCQKRRLLWELNRLRDKVRRNSKATKSILASIAGLQEKLKLTHDKISDDQAKVSKIEASILLLEDFSPEFLAKRNEMLRLSQQTQRKDITVKEVEYAVAEYQKCNKIFQEEYCPHRYLIGYRSYQGSRSDDYDDSYSAYRVCILCEKSETAKPGFETLSLISGERLLYCVNEGNECKDLQEIEDVCEKLSEQPIKTIVDFYQNAIDNEYWYIERKESEPAE